MPQKCPLDETVVPPVLDHQVIVKWVRIVRLYIICIRFELDDSNLKKKKNNSNKMKFS